MRSNSNATSMNIRIDRGIKESAKAVFAELGLDLSTAVNIFFRQAIRENGIPFGLTLNTPNKETLEAIKEVQKMKKNPSLGKSYNNVDDMMKELLA